jgi:hypothetical protein
VPTLSDVVEDRTPVRRLEFVEVRTSAPTTRRRKAQAGRPVGAETPNTTAQPEAQAAVIAGEPRWSLWGDSDG